MIPEILRASMSHVYKDRYAAIEMYAFWQLRPVVEGSLLTFGLKTINGDLFVRTRFGYLPVNRAGMDYET